MNVADMPGELVFQFGIIWMALAGCMPSLWSLRLRDACWRGGRIAIMRWRRSFLNDLLCSCFIAIQVGRITAEVGR